MKSNVILLMVAVVVLIASGQAQSEIREYILGDIDDFTYNGPGSVDDVYVDPVWRSYGERMFRPVHHFDVLESLQNILFTFLYDLGEYEEVTGGNLTLAMRNTDSSYTQTEIGIEGIDSYYFSDLGWSPVPDTGMVLKTLDLSNVLGDDYLPYLQDGQLNASVCINMALDYAILEIDVIPEPMTFFLFALGFMKMRKTKNMKEN